MIFVTVGTQFGFDRLIKTVDVWASAQQPPVKCIAQIGAGDYKPQSMEWVRYLEPEEFEHIFEECDLVVAHAGMGTIITALLKGKPVIVLPRLAEFSEHRNDHQVATAKKLSSLEGCHFAAETEDVQRYLSSHELLHGGCLKADVLDDLLGNLEMFINSAV